MNITRRSFGLAALGGMLLPALPALAKAPLTGAQAAGVYRLKVGSFEVTVLNDGSLPIETKLFTGSPEGAAKLLEGRFLSKEAIPTAVNEWLVNTGDKLILVDTGTSNLFGPGLGRMVKNLAAAGVDPAAVDMVILTHLHPDHAAGLLTADKKIAFANATVHVSEAEYAFWTSAEISAKAPDDFKPFFEMARNSIKPYVDAGKVEKFKDRTEFAPGIVASAAPGHTVGHTMVHLSSGPGQLLLWGDIVHNAALQFPRPGDLVRHRPGNGDLEPQARVRHGGDRQAPDRRLAPAVPRPRPRRQGCERICLRAGGVGRGSVGRAKIAMAIVGWGERSETHIDLAATAQ
jgi:glyoxylase-like metal-dependent hydrolase (beta-lactamase superfamily II)